MLLCFTASHRTAGFDLLERLERRADDVTTLLRSSDSVRGSVVLATCNRFETYIDVDGDADAAIADLLLQVSRGSGIPAEELSTSSATIAHHAVAEHLFSVSSGLESVVVGEGEIAGQVRRSIDAAREAGSVTRDLERLFQVASRTQRGVKNRTELSRAGRSIVRLALELAESRVTDWSQTRVLLVGTGTYAGATLAALRERGADDVRVYSRTGRARAFAAGHGIVDIPVDALESAIAESDIVITCSVAPATIVDTAMLERVAAVPDALSRRLIIDLGLPRNVDPAVADVEGTELLDLETISLHAPLEELQAGANARAIVGEAAAAFAARTAEEEIEPALIALRRQVFDVLDAEIARARSHGDASERTEAALRHLTGVLLHTPSVRARELARNGNADAFINGIEAVFGIEAAGPVADATSAHVAGDADADAGQRVVGDDLAS